MKNRSLTKDYIYRELAFYGTEDLTPSEFYSVQDASRALEQARKARDFVGPLVK